LELEPEAENSRSKKRSSRRGRKPKTTLTKQIEEAYNHLHDLDWLEESHLARLPELQEKVNPRQIMAEAQVLRGILIEAAEQVMVDLEDVPDMSRIHFFLKSYLAGRRVFEIADEMGISREQCSRRYRKESFNLAGAQFMRLLSTEN
jgi:DNA-directed RNA polymerase specialized sigma24 family protein